MILKEVAEILSRTERGANDIDISDNVRRFIAPGPNNGHTFANTRRKHISIARFDSLISGHDRKRVRNAARLIDKNSLHDRKSPFVKMAQNDRNTSAATEQRAHFRDNPKRRTGLVYGRNEAQNRRRTA